MTTVKMPALFVGHGSPMNVLAPDNPFNQGFRHITQTFAKPKAILMISAHWYINGLQIMTAEQPPMIYDFSGFPDELYQVDYPAKGSRPLAERVMQLLADDHIVANSERGFDHGAWAVLKYLYPDADVPVVQLSLDRTKPAEWHYHLAKKLAILREEGVLIVASGDIVHNLRAIDWKHIDTVGAGYDWAYQFRQEINQAMLAYQHDTLIHYEQLGEPAYLSVPTPDHYLPLLYIMAVTGHDDAIHLFNDELVAGSISMTSVKVG